VLKDGRKLDVPATITMARPQVLVLNKNVQLPPAPPQETAHINLTAPNELPLDGKLTFALKSQVPSSFARGESIEIATGDGMASVNLSLSSGQLVLQDAKTAIATLDPLKAFGTSAFGPLEVRPVMADGTAGDWQPLATLVRLPVVAALTCPPDPTAPCSLTGSGLYLIDSVGADPQFTKSMSVPDGFAGSSLDLPHMTGQELFVKLRDDPSVVNTLQLDAPVVAKTTRPTRPGGRRSDTAATQGLNPTSPDFGAAPAPALAAPSPTPAASPAGSEPPAVAPLPQPQPELPATAPHSANPPPARSPANPH
jgi:hypothetical protein